MSLSKAVVADTLQRALHALINVNYFSSNQHITTMNSQTQLRCCGVNWPFITSSSLDAELSREEVRQTYDRIAWIYDAWAWLTESKAQKRVLEFAEVCDGSSILEVAVGTGRIFAVLVTQNPSGKNMGIDLTDAMLVRARRRLKSLDQASYWLTQGDAFALPFDEGSFDLLVNQYLFDLVPYEEMDDLIIEFKRVLKGGGKLIMTNMTEPQTIGGRLYPLIYRFSPRAMGGCRPVQLSQHLRRHGFEVARREYLQQTLFPSEVIVAYKR